jgi:RNA polymerase sigma factor (TIGR02999 family)
METRESESSGDFPRPLTRLLNEAAAGDAAAAEKLFPLIYDQLRAMAQHQMRMERPDITLQATALVHEAYIRLIDQDKVQRWESRWQFFAAAGQAMRRILVEQARSRGRLKRGGDRQRVDLENLTLAASESGDDLLALDEALNRLAEEHPEKAQLVNLRFFGGLTQEEASKALNVSISTADRYWSFARAWLYRLMAGED